MAPRGVSRPSGSNFAAGSVLVGGAAPEVGSWARECVAEHSKRKTPKAMQRVCFLLRNLYPVLMPCPQNGLYYLPSRQPDEIAGFYTSGTVILPQLAFASFPP
jgi:hypothetical protein